MGKGAAGGDNQVSIQLFTKEFTLARPGRNEKENPAILNNSRR